MSDHTLTLTLGVTICGLLAAMLALAGWPHWFTFRRKPRALPREDAQTTRRAESSGV